MTNTVTNQKSQTSYKAQKIISNVIIYAFLISLLLLSIVPFYLVVVNATHSSFDIVTKLNLLPGKNTLKNPRQCRYIHSDDNQCDHKI